MADEPIVGAVGATPPPSAPPAEPTFEDLQKAHPTLSKFKTPFDAAKAYTELEKWASGKTALPDFKDPKAVAEFNKKIGVPDSPDKYPQLDPNFNPKNVPVSKEWNDFWYKAAHKYGLRPDQANGIAQELYGNADEQVNQEKAQAEIQKAEVQKKMTQNFGTALNQVVDDVTRFLTKKGELETAKAGGVFENPDMLRAFHKVSLDYKEDRSITKPEHRNISNMVPQQLAERKMELMKTPEYLNGNHPKHRERINEVNEIYKILAEASGGNKEFYQVKNMR